MSERPAEEGSEVDEKGNGPDSRVSEDGKSILSVVNAVTSKMTCPNTQPPSSAKGSRSSSTIPLGASKPAVGRWTNRCALCNGLSSPRHSSTACCIVCRNYSDIDDVAKKWKARNILAIQLPQGETFKAILRREQQQSRELRREETELHRVAESWREKANSLHGRVTDAHNEAQRAQDKYNRIVEANPHVTPESTAAKAEYGTAKAKLDELTGSFEAKRASFEKAAKDLDAVRDTLGKQAISRTHVIDKLAARLLYLARIQPADQIGRARLFFSWVAKSLRYDRIAHEQRRRDERTPIDTIFNGYEVCHGFANLFNTMFNSGYGSKGPGRSIYVSGYMKNRDFHRPPAENSHAWNAFPLEDGNWKLIDPTWACGAVYNEAGHETFDPTCFTKSNEEFLRTHIPENERDQFRANGKPSLDSAMLWDLDLVDCALQSKLFRINEASMKPPHRTIKVSSASRTVFKFKKSCTHYDGWYHCFVVWIGNAPKNGNTVIIDTDDLILVPPLLDNSGWRVSTELPQDKSSAILFALMSDGQPAQITCLDEWKRMDTKRTYAIVARWDLETAE